MMAEIKRLREIDRIELWFDRTEASTLPHAKKGAGKRAARDRMRRLKELRRQADGV